MAIINVNEYIEMSEICETLFHLEYDQVEDSLSLMSDNDIRLIYETVARNNDLCIPSGFMDSNYARNNMIYLIDAYWDAEEFYQWSYRLYVCFSGQADESACAFLHCYNSYRFANNNSNETEINPRNAVTWRHVAA